VQVCCATSTGRCHVSDSCAPQIEGTCSGRYGFIIAVTNVLSMGKGMIREGTGSASFNVRYMCLVFRPFRGEVIDCVVSSVNKARAPVRPATGSQHPCSVLASRARAVPRKELVCQRLAVTAWEARLPRWPPHPGARASSAPAEAPLSRGPGRAGRLLRGRGPSAAVRVQPPHPGRL